MKTIYLDNAATTKVDKEVEKIIKKYSTLEYGNASSSHHKGFAARKAIDTARKIIADSIGANPKEIIFTSGGTESNNLALKGIAFANKDKGNHIIISKIEHDCVLNAAKWLETQGFNVTYLNVDAEGFISINELEKAITDKTILVSIIHGNNEIGTIQDLEKIGAVCRNRQVLFHTDACQSYTKTELNVNKHNLDLVTLNAHKIHGPKGVGALYIRKGIKITPLNHGGGHEFGIRNGTENVAGIAGFARAVQIGISKMSKIKIMSGLRDHFIEKALEIPDTKLNGPKGDKRLCNNANISFRYVEGESIVAMLDLKGICTSTGSACSSHTLDPSHVMMALEENPERAHGSIRFSISRDTTKKEIDYTLKELKKIIAKLREISPLRG